MTKKEKFKKWCKENKYVVGAGLLIVSCAGAAIGFTTLRKTNKIKNSLEDLSDLDLGLLGKVLDVESRSGWEAFVYDDDLKLSDLGNFGADLLKSSATPEGISLDTKVNGVLVIMDNK